jgi:excisionase family DNA binding protein
MTTPTERPRALTVDAAAAKLKISRRTVYRLIQDGALTPVRVGNRRAVTEKSVLDYMTRQTPEYEIVDEPTEAIITGAPGGAPCSVSSSDTENNSD